MTGQEWPSPPFISRIIKNAKEKKIYIPFVNYMKTRHVVGVAVSQAQGLQYFSTGMLRNSCLINRSSVSKTTKRGFAIDCLRENFRTVKTKDQRILSVHPPTLSAITAT
jgi:hypothetical protein